MSDKRQAVTKMIMDWYDEGRKRSDCDVLADRILAAVEPKVLATATIRYADGNLTARDIAMALGDRRLDIIVDAKGTYRLLALVDLGDAGE